jgi:hypothetical protein
VIHKFSPFLRILFRKSQESIQVLVQLYPIGISRPVLYVSASVDVNGDEKLRLQERRV